MTAAEKVMRDALARARARGPGGRDDFEVRGLRHEDAFAALEAIRSEPDVYKADRHDSNNYWIELRGCES